MFKLEVGASTGEGVRDSNLFAWLTKRPSARHDSLTPRAKLASFWKFDVVCGGSFWLLLRERPQSKRVGHSAKGPGEVGEC